MTFDNESNISENKSENKSENESETESKCKSEIILKNKSEYENKNKSKKQNIVLIGMPGCGKSTTGVLLAKTLGMSFLDTDLIIQERENCRLQEIIDSRGFDGFLKAEEQAILSINISGTVIATGGSVIYSEAGIDHLKENGIVVYLKVDSDEIERRITNISTRGIALHPGQTLSQLYNERAPLYEKYANITIPIEKQTIEETVTILATHFLKI